MVTLWHRRASRTAPTVMAFLLTRSWSLAEPEIGWKLASINGVNPTPVSDDRSQWFCSLSTCCRFNPLTGAKMVSHGRYATFQLAEVPVSRQMLADIPSLIAQLRAPPALWVTFSLSFQPSIRRDFLSA